jgi:hypothetical protein
MKHRYWLPSALLGLLLFQPSVWANSGTPLMWAGALHLAFGNLLIGLGEGWLLAKLRSIPKAQTLPAMIIANYFSAWLGYLVYYDSLKNLLAFDLYNAWRWFWVLMAAAYLVSVLLEWPFVWWCCRTLPPKARRSWRATFLVQGASYLVICGWFWLASYASLYTQMRIAKPSEVALPPAVQVYYLGAEDGNVYRRLLAGGPAQKVYDLRSTNRSDVLFIEPVTNNANHWNFIALLRPDYPASPIRITLLTNVPVETLFARDQLEKDSIDYEQDAVYGWPFRLVETPHGNWQFWYGPYACEGLTARNAARQIKLRVAMETPFTAWRVHYLSALPTDKALFQLGDDQICGFDPETRSVALLWRGRCPVPVIPRP